jgi:hypothetical protein
MTEYAEMEIFEGTWEELLTHSDRFAGRRFRLLPLDAPEADTAAPGYPEGDTLDKVLAPFLAEMSAWQPDAEDAPEPNRLAPLKQEVSDLVAAKFRRQGFDV